MKRLAYQVVLAASADHDFLEIMAWSAAQFGNAAADRYQALIGQALTGLGDDPFRHGARRRNELPAGIFTYHLAASRERVTGDRVKAPRHFVMYRTDPLLVQVLRFLHDSRDLAKHLPEVFT